MYIEPRSVRSKLFTATQLILTTQTAAISNNRQQHMQTKTLSPNQLWSLVSVYLWPTAHNRSHSHTPPARSHDWLYTPLLLTPRCVSAMCHWLICKYFTVNKQPAQWNTLLAAVPSGQSCYWLFKHCIARNLYYLPTGLTHFPAAGCLKNA